ncbi:hypothetical protein J11TS1_04590 [Oceanobacillus sp. J11TS1]|nr:hypothetical protein J11TS1_04590 [Oceanobacillus sp. J11TS1]
MQKVWKKVTNQSFNSLKNAAFLKKGKKLYKHVMSTTCSALIYDIIFVNTREKAQVVIFLKNNG